MIKNGRDKTARCGEPLAVDGFPGISKVLNPEGGSLHCSDCRAEDAKKKEEREI